MRGWALQSGLVCQRRSRIQHQSVAIEEGDAAEDDQRSRIQGKIGGGDGWLDQGFFGETAS